MGAFYCAVCRQTFFCGKKHIFGKSHQSRLRVVILKFIEKVKEARRTIKRPQVERLDGTQQGGTFWCYCCGVETERNVTDGNMVVLHGGLLEHMATPEHKKNTQRFWWEYKADPKLRDKVLITTEDTERFKAEVANALASYVDKEDTVVQQHTAMIHCQERHRLAVLQSIVEPEVEQELSNGCQSQEMPVEEASRPLGWKEKAGPSWGEPMADGQWAGPEKGLTFIGNQDSSNGGNVHTGAVPPWLQDDPLKGGSVAEVGPNLQDFLKHSKKRLTLRTRILPPLLILTHLRVLVRLFFVFPEEQEKLRKLPPNRVGANFDHNSQTNADWLPSFGRVWNSGRRWQSRSQFREEEGRKKREKRRESGDSKKIKPTP
ncbi:Coiled-coil domain-containing protein 84 [Merluccius polli]|uniref:Coiled-coil domain-containing protein 84 n=1 Tax=Merluccius polli TaxID=89951 RepID=A0AA47NXE4_MERPO|nr:Coiled-coil domain-containing protein 84 [Merluccius polli]